MDCVGLYMCVCVCVYNDTIMSIRGYGLCRPGCVCVYIMTL